MFQEYLFKPEHNSLSLRYYIDLCVTKLSQFPRQNFRSEHLISSLDVAPTLLPKGGGLCIQLQAHTAQKDVYLDFQSKMGVFPIIGAFQSQSVNLKIRSQLRSCFNCSNQKQKQEVDLKIQVFGDITTRQSDTFQGLGVNLLHTSL